MDTEELRKFNKKDLKDRLAQKRKELIDIKFDIKIAKDNDYSKINQIRREIARILTILNQESYKLESK